MGCSIVFLSVLHVPAPLTKEPSQKAHRLPLDMWLACREALSLGFLLLWGTWVKTGVGGEKGTHISGGIVVVGGVCVASAGVQLVGGERLLVQATF